MQRVSTPAIQTDDAIIQEARHKVAPVQLWLVRHGETEWSASGQHTGRTDLPLTRTGEQQARQIGKFLRGRRFGIVLTSPLLRATETCRLAGYGDNALVDENLQEWDYGEYEGRTTREIQEHRPGWSLWRDGVPGGESIEQVATRAQAVIDRALANSGDALLFAHGHSLRILACCWLGLPLKDARLFALCTAKVTTLGYEHETRVMTRLNAGLTAEHMRLATNHAQTVQSEPSVVEENRGGAEKNDGAASCKSFIPIYPNNLPTVPKPSRRSRTASLVFSDLPASQSAITRLLNRRTDPRN